MMLKTEFLVIGSGFSGSLTALCLHRIGRQVVVVDRSVHPRFAVGESSTPLADLQLMRIADEFGFPWLRPLATYGTWKADCPQLTCGLKRGFSYFRHRPHHEFESDSAHGNELLVAASPCDEAGDTHWLRSDVDAFLAAHLAGEGIPFFEGTTLTLRSRSPWIWSGTHAGTDPVEVKADFVVDASGPAGVIPHALDVPPCHEGFQTCSRSLYGHVVDLIPWHDLLIELGVATDDHPFRCDRAAGHHLIDEGWMWQLPFDNGVTSVGFVLAGTGDGSPPSVEWDRLLARYPSLNRQFRHSRLVAPKTGLQSTGRLQRRWSQLADADYVLLPAAAGFIDPLHSTGIAHSLNGLRTFVTLVETQWGRPAFITGLKEYENRLHGELRTIDRLVAACYATRDRMDLFEAATALYFTAAIRGEERLQSGESPAFLSLDDELLRSVLLEESQSLINARFSAADSERTLDRVRRAIGPWNTAGLLDPGVRRMYRYTAADKGPLPRWQSTDSRID